MNLFPLLSIQPPPNIDNIFAASHVIGTLFSLTAVLAVLGFFFMIICACIKKNIPKKVWKGSICSFVIPIILIPILLYANMYCYVKAASATKPHISSIENLNLVVGETYDIGELADFENVTRDSIYIYRVTDPTGYTTDIEYTLNEDSHEITFTKGSGTVIFTFACNYRDVHTLTATANLSEE